MNTIAEDNRCETLWRAAEAGNLGAVSEILSDGVDVDAANAYGTTALIRAVAAGRTQIVSLLLERGANPNGTRNDGFTPLLLAAFFGHADIVKNLIEYGANSKATSRFGTSAQMWACARTFHTVADYLEKQQPQSLVVQTVEPAQTRVSNPLAESLPETSFVDPVKEICNVQRPTFDRRHTALACVLSVALMLGGAMFTRIKLWPKESIASKTIQSVAAAERVRTNEQAAAPATAVAQESEKKPENNHHTPQSDTQSKERNGNSARVPGVSPITPPSFESTPAEITSQPTDVQPLPIAPVEVKSTANITPNAKSNGSAPSRIPVNNSLLISPKGSSKSGKVIPWP